MNLFSDIYNCYYQIMKNILNQPGALSEKDIRSIAGQEGFEESPLFILPKILSGEWDFFIHKDNVYISKLQGGFTQPLSHLQKCYISALLLDEKICLFFNKEELSRLKEIFSGYSPLWMPDDFYYYDCFSDKDDFSSPLYIHNFQTILSAIKNRQCTSFTYEGKNSTNKHDVLPCRLEYSIKNGRFRLIAVPVSCLDHISIYLAADAPYSKTASGSGTNEHPAACKGKNNNRHNIRIETYNLCNICEITSLCHYTGPLPDINMAIIKSYYKEPVRLIIKNRRNALERTMLQFANYEKNTVKIDDDTYECCIYYNKNTETELLIEVLSFGPLIQVTGNSEFLGHLKMRLRKQAQLIQE
ncbi:MAG: WYL domain-containing protein [Lachnospiraceae bacterium]|nr:WYL domain-containing protein [Lachnospiraceae bacterium]